MFNQEYADIQNNPPPGCTIKLPNEDDMNVWDVYMTGPEDTPYAVSTFLSQSPYAHLLTDVDRAATS